MRRRTLIIADAAKADLDGIYDHIAADNEASADQFIKRFVAKLKKLATIGFTGAPRDFIRPGLRSYPYGSYCAYFRIDDKHFKVARIVHSARDIDAIAFDPSEPSE